jgi:hypothetical protein
MSARVWWMWVSLVLGAVRLDEDIGRDLLALRVLTVALGEHGALVEDGVPLGRSGHHCAGYIVVPVT